MPPRIHGGKPRRSGIWNMRCNTGAATRPPRYVSTASPCSTTALAWSTSPRWRPTSRPTSGSPPNGSPVPTGPPTARDGEARPGISAGERTERTAGRHASPAPAHTASASAVKRAQNDIAFRFGDCCEGSGLVGRIERRRTAMSGRGAGAGVATVRGIARIHPTGGGACGRDRRRHGAAAESD